MSAEKEKPIIPEKLKQQEIKADLPPDLINPEPEVPSGEQAPELKEDNHEKIEEVRSKIEELPGAEKNIVPEANITPPVAESIIPEGLMQSLQKDRLNVLVENARHILGQEATDEQVKNLASQTFKEYVRALLFSVMPRSEKSLLGITDFSGRENIDKTLKKFGKMIVVSPHMSYFPTGMKMIRGLMPENTKGTALVEKNPLWPLVKAFNKIRNFFRGGRAKEKNFELMVKEAKNPATLLSVVHRLKSASPEGQKQIFFMAGDRGDLSPDGKRAPVDFFDSQVNFPTGPATISRLGGAPLVPVYITRESNGMFKVNIGEPIEVNSQQDHDTAIQEATQKYADFFAAGIKDHPEQWPVYRHDYWPGQKNFKPAGT